MSIAIGAIVVLSFSLFAAGIVQPHNNSNGSKVTQSLTPQYKQITVLAHKLNMTIPTNQTSFIDQNLNNTDYGPSILLSVDFLNYSEQHNINIDSLSSLTKHQLDATFSGFVSNYTGAGIALKNLTLLQKAEFQQQNNKIGKSFIQAQQNGNSTPNYTFNTMTAKNGAEITVASQGHNPGTDFVRVSNLPSGVGSDGQWTMVSVNYFVYHAPWWLGGWSVTYGEQDTINSLYAGNDAQHFVNSATNGANDQAILDGIALGAIGTGLAFAAPTLGISALAGGIIAGILAATGAAVAYLTSQWTGKLNSLYQSTYANEPAGKKYVWMYDVIDYYYPSVTVVGVLASSIGQYGYLSNGNVVTFSGNVPFISYGGFTGLDQVVALSGFTQAIGNSYGWNTWLYGGNPN